jgi:hypothetical protein
VELRSKSYRNALYERNSPVAYRAYRIWRCVARLAAVVLGLTDALTVACDRVSGLDALGETIENEPPSRLERYTGIHVPDGAREIHSWRRQVVAHQFVLMRFELDASGLPEFLRGSSFVPPVPGPPPAELDEPDPPAWWTPAQTRHPLVSKELRRVLLVDAADPARLIVYVYAMQ